MARWMANKGAKNIVLSSRSGKLTDKLEKLTNDLAAQGTKIVVHPCDVSDAASVEKLIKKDMAELPAVRGVVHAPMVLKVCYFNSPA